MKMHVSALIVALVLCLGGAAGVGQADTSADSATHTAKVDIADFSFKPDALTVHTGATVVFQNDDDITHNVSSDTFKSPDIDGGKSWSHTFSKAGAYTYVCTYHPGMSGTITVTDD